MQKRRTISNVGWRTIVRAGVVALLTLTFMAAVQAGGDVWKTKPFQQWTQNDVKQILQNSPWVKVELVPAEWHTTPGMNQAPSVGSASSAGMGSPQVEATRANAGRPGEQPMGTPPGQASYSVRWNSSRTVREALVREAELSGRMKDSEAAQYLNAPMNDYEVAVLGPDMTPFGGVSEDDFKAKAYLRGKQSRVQVNPTKVEMVRSPDGRVMVVVFTFPRKTADGKDVVAPQEKGLQFACKLKNLDLGATFDPRKMTDQKGPDF